MTIFGFKRKWVAENAAANARQRPPGTAAQPQDQVIGRGWIARSPSGGIPARTDNLAGTASCEIFYINSGGILTNLVKPPSQGSVNFQLTVYNISPQAIPGGEYLPVWMLNGLPTVSIGGGGGGTPSVLRVKYRIARRLSAQENGEWVATALLVDGGSAPNPLDAQNPIVPGSEFIVSDPDNRFPFPTLHDDLPPDAIIDGATGSIGWAILRTPSSSAENPPGLYRWEIETQSLPVKRLRVWLDECLLHDDYLLDPGHETTVYFDYGRQYKFFDWSGCDFPNDTGAGIPGFAYSLAATNPLGLTAVSNSWAWIELYTDTLTSQDNTDVPHAFGAVDPKWRFVEVEKPIAKWLQMDLGIAGWERTSGGEYAQGYPVDEDTYPGPCPPGYTGKQTCATELTQVWGFYKPEAHEYEAISSESALLGPPTTVLAASAVSYDSSCNLTVAYSEFAAFCVGGGPTDVVPPPGDDLVVITGVNLVPDCGFEFLTKTIKACATPAQSIYRRPLMQQVPVVTQVYSDGNDICFTSVTVEVCSWSGGSSECIDICQLLCDCYGNYSQPDFCLPPPPTCIDKQCNYIWDETLTEWLPNVTCPDLTDCDCPPPPELPGAYDGEISDFQDCGCVGTCQECSFPNTKWEVTLLSHSDQAPNQIAGCNPPASQGGITLLGEISNDGCTVVHECYYGYTQQNEILPCEVKGTVQITKSGSTWQVTYLGPGSEVFNTNPVIYSGQSTCEDSLTTGNVAVIGPNETVALQTRIVCENRPARDGTPARAFQAPANSGLGDAFIEAETEWFKGCGCKTSVKHILNRWQSVDDATDARLNNIARTIANKTQGVDLMTIQTRLRAFIWKWFDAKK